MGANSANNLKNNYNDSALWVTLENLSRGLHCNYDDALIESAANNFYQNHKISLAAECK